MTAPHLDTFTLAFIESALWLARDSDGDSIDGLGFDVTDIEANTLASIIEDCADFQAAHREAIEGCEATAGRDFYLTRNRHGAGFWDGDRPDEIGRALTSASHAYGSFDLYVSDDGVLHGCS